MKGHAYFFSGFDELEVQIPQAARFAAEEAEAKGAASARLKQYHRRSLIKNVPPFKN
ncbi:hypothetical protein [Salsuginibacillus kocurii]|uniref:hypothetical protein n=1 Tax=Salsuginibacillus kocurii TaxID=427078 RepID=UPI00036D1FE7|nr:hypothetical protein [Salsuginibacillus kocurii]